MSKAQEYIAMANGRIADKWQAKGSILLLTDAQAKYENVIRNAPEAIEGHAKAKAKAEAMIEAQKKAKAEAEAEAKKKAEAGAKAEVEAEVKAEKDAQAKEHAAAQALENAETKAKADMRITADVENSTADPEGGKPSDNTAQGRAKK